MDAPWPAGNFEEYFGGYQGSLSPGSIEGRAIFCQDGSVEAGPLP